MKVKLAVAVAMLFFPTLAHADSIYEIQFSDTIYVNGSEDPATELVTGSLDWDQTTATISNESVTDSGSLFTAVTFEESPTSFYYTLSGDPQHPDGTYTISFFFDNQSLIAEAGGTVIGTGINANDLYLTEFYLKPTSTPEPSSLLLFGMGVVALIVLRREKHSRKRSAQNRILMSV